MCSCKSKISGMKKLNFKSLSDKLIPVATMSFGFAAAKAVPALVNKVYKPSSGAGLSNTIVGVSQIVAGVVLSSMKNKHLANVGLGVAISGAHTFLVDPVNKALETAGLSGIHAYGTPGSYNYRPNYAGVGCPSDTEILK